jgi:uncharacterized membrane protein YtjA (UPF0391 family)
MASVDAASHAAGGTSDFPRYERFSMLKWAFAFLVLGLIAGLLGFTGIAGASIGIAKVLFVIFMLIFAALIVAGVALGRRVS